MKWIWLIALIVPYQAESDGTSTIHENPRPTKQKIRPQYANCKGVDLSSLELEGSAFREEEAAFCFGCSVKKTFGFGELKESSLALQSKAFMEKLKKRVIGRIESKIYQTKVLRACATGDRNWLSAQKVDWPLMKEVCKHNNQELKSSIKSRWTEMRVNLALSKANPYQPVRESRLSFPYKHEISDFDSFPRLTETENNLVKKRWVEEMAQTPLDTFTPEELKTHFLKGGTLSGLMPEDQLKLKRATWNMQKKAKDSYFEIVSEMPLLGYLKSGNPKTKELGGAFTKIEGSLKDLLKKAKDPEADKGLFLSFKPLVEELLREDKSYCLAAERERIKAEKKQSLENWTMLGIGVLAAAPCFLTGPIGTSICVTAGMALGITGYREAQSASDEALGRALTGGHFETMAELDKKEKEEFLAKLFLPLEAFGAAAVAARAAAKSFKNIQKKPRAQSTAKETAELLNENAAIKNRIHPEDVHIKKIRPAAGSQTKAFHVKFMSPDKEEIRFHLNIPDKLLEQDKLDLEKQAGDLLQSGKLNSAEEVNSFIQENNLLSAVQKIVADMPEIFSQSRKITFDELHSMAGKRVKERILQNSLKKYGSQDAGRSKLSSIGPENVDIKKTGSQGELPVERERGLIFEEYNVQFKTRKGEQMNIKLGINKTARYKGEEVIPGEPSIRRLTLSGWDLSAKAAKEKRIPFEELRHTDLAELERKTIYLDIKDKMKLAIGRMPAEIFEGLNSITIAPLKGERTVGRVRVAPEAPAQAKAQTNVGTADKRHAFSKMPFHRLINDSVARAWKRAAKGESSHMEIFVHDLEKKPYTFPKPGIVGILAHELGHVLQINKLGGSKKTPKNWDEAMQKDIAKVSDYGDKNASEDFAEAMRLYILTDGGVKQPEIMEDIANRFQILDKVMKQSLKERASTFQKFTEAMEHKGLAFVAGAGVLTHIILENQVHILPSNEDIDAKKDN